MSELTRKLKAVINTVNKIERINGNKYKLSNKNRSFTLERAISNYEVVLDINIDDRPFWTGIRFDDELKEVWESMLNKDFKLREKGHDKKRKEIKNFWEQL